MGRFDKFKVFDGEKWLLPRHLQVFNGKDWVDFGEADSFVKKHIHVYNGIRLRRITLERQDFILKDDKNKYIIDAKTGEKIYKYEKDRIKDLTAPKGTKWI